MRESVRAIADAISILLLVLRPAAVAAGSPEPVRIESCRILNTKSYVSAYKPIVVSFANERPVSADVVSFTIKYGERTERVTDKGVFAPGVRIEHAFNGFYNAQYRGPTPAGCTVEYVHFTDGSAWPAAPAAVPTRR
jgi:hypothetical protein